MIDSVAKLFYNATVLARKNVRDAHNAAEELAADMMQNISRARQLEQEAARHRCNKKLDEAVRKSILLCKRLEPKHEMLLTYMEQLKPYLHDNSGADYV